MRTKVRLSEHVSYVIAEMQQDGWNVQALIDGGDGLYIMPGKNIVTNDGDRYYAQKAAGETATNTWTRFLLGTGTTAPTKADTTIETFITGSNRNFTAGYPRTNDPDALNTGSGQDMVSWGAVWAVGTLVQSGIAEGVITILGATTPILCRWKFASPFNIIVTESLRVYVNHTVAGV